MSIYWITGLPGSGKSTFGKQLCLQLSDLGRASVQIDGDLIRECFMGTFGYTREQRVFLGKAYLNLSIMFSLQNLDVVVSTVSLFKEVHDFILDKRELHKIRIIVIRAQNDLLDSRNQKNLRSENQQHSPDVNLKIEYPEFIDLQLHGDETLESQRKIISEILLNE